MTREFVLGDRVGFDVEGEVNQHDAVTIVGERTVGQTGESDEEVWGVAMNSGSEADEDRITVVQHGLYTAHVSDSATVNDYLTASGTPGQLRALEDTEEIQVRLFRALEDLPEENRMLVYIS